MLKIPKTTRLYSGRKYEILIVVFKSLFVSSYPKYLKKLFSLPATPNIHKREFLSLPEPRTTANALETFKYETAKLWNSLKDDMTQIISIDDFTNSLRNLNFH